MTAAAAKKSRKNITKPKKAIAKKKSVSKILKVKKPERKTLEQTRIPVELIDFWKDNPNEQDDFTYKKLKDKILDQYGDPEKMDQAIHVIPNPKEEGRFLAFSGNHRLKAVRELGAFDVQCSIFHHWDMNKMVTEAISDNLVRGSYSATKMTKLVNKMVNNYGENIDELAEKWSFRKKSDLDKLIVKAEEEQPEVEIEPPSKDKDRKPPGQNNPITSSLKTVLKMILEENLEDINSGYAFFTLNGNVNCLVEITSKEEVEFLGEAIKTAKKKGCSLKEAMTIQ